MFSNKIANERRPIPTRICHRPHYLHLVPHRHRLTTLHRPIPVPHQYCSQVWRTPSHQRRAGTACTQEHPPRRAEAQHARTLCSTSSLYLTHSFPISYRKMCGPDPVTAVLTQKKRASSGASQDNAIPTVSERRPKSRARLPVDDDNESDGAQAYEEPLAGSRVCATGLANVDTLRRSAVVSVSRRSLIEDEGR
jgi:hypothetical protein